MRSIFIRSVICGDGLNPDGVSRQGFAEERRTGRFFCVVKGFHDLKPLTREPRGGTIGIEFGITQELTINIGLYLSLRGTDST